MSTAKFDTLSNLDGTRTIPVSTVAQGTARAWVNFNGTGTVAIRASFNVSSITDNGTGDYTVNFTTALSDANYCTTGTCVFDSANSGQVISNAGAGGQTTAGVRIGVRYAPTAALNDVSGVAIAIFR